MGKQQKRTVSEELLAGVRNYLERTYCDPEYAIPAAMQEKAVSEEICLCAPKCNYSMGQAALPGIEEEKKTTEKRRPSSILKTKRSILPGAGRIGAVPDSLAERLKQTEETFTQAMLRVIRKNNWTEPEVYNRIFMDRKLFNKIRNKPDYQPRKSTAILLAMALRLNLDETMDLIGKAGFTLSHSSRSDIIVEYFIRNGNYDVLELNEVLEAFGQPLLDAIIKVDTKG